MDKNLALLKRTPKGMFFSNRISFNLIHAIGIFHWLGFFVLGLSQSTALTLTLAPFSWVSWIFALIFLVLLLKTIVSDILLAWNFNKEIGLEIIIIMSMWLSLLCKEKWSGKKLGSMIASAATRRKNSSLIWVVFG